MEHDRDWLKVAAASGALAFSSGPLIQFSFAVFLPHATSAFPADRATLSVALTLALTMSGVTTLAVGHLVDRFGSLLPSLVAILLTAASLASVGLFAISPLTFIVLYGFAGAFSSAIAPLPFARMIARRFDSRLGLALGIAMAGVGVGASMLPQLVSHLIAISGWRMAYAELAIILCIVALPLTILALRGEEALQIGVSARIDGYTGREALKTRKFWLIGALFFVLACTCNGLVAHSVAMLTDRGMTPSRAVDVLSVTGIAVVVGRLACGLLLDHFDPARVAAYIFATAALGTSFILVGGATEAALAGMLLVGFCLGAEIDLMAFMNKRYFGERNFAQIYGYFFFIFVMGSASGPLIMGLSKRAGSYDQAMIGLIAALLVAGLFALRLKGKEGPVVAT